MRLLVILAAAAASALGCECASMSVCDRARAQVIFVGEVIDGGISSLRQDPWYSADVNHVRFKVLERLRGLSASTRTVDLELFAISGMCSSIPYFRGHRYLVATSKSDKRREGPCFDGRDVDLFPDDLRQMRQYLAGNLQHYVHGTVANVDFDLVEYRLSKRQATPLRGVAVTASRGRKKYTAVTDDAGRYAFVLPSAGVYQLRARLGSIESEPEEVEVERSGCEAQEQNLGLRFDNTISGRVLDERGQAVRELKVGLIDLDRQPSSGVNRSIWFPHRRLDQPDSTFQFENVPAGRYLLILNPDGPRSDGSPLESTYYPSGATRADAKIVQIKPSGTHLTGMDLVAGKPVEFRDVYVGVQFSDGKPMETAHVRCTALPLQAGDVAWIAEQSITNGSVHFFAPSNRKLLLEISDRYGRDLKRAYSSTHEPGSTQIMQEFVVTP